MGDPAPRQPKHRLHRCSCKAIRHQRMKQFPQEDKVMCPSPSRLARDKGACRLSAFPAWARKLTRGDVSLLSVGSTFKPQVIAGGFGHPPEGTGAGVG